MAKIYNPTFNPALLSTYYQFFCTKCHYLDYYPDESAEAMAAKLFKEGWRTDGDDCYCPKCVEEFADEIYPLKLNLP